MCIVKLDINFSLMFLLDANHDDANEFWNELDNSDPASDGT